MNWLRATIQRIGASIGNVADRGGTRFALVPTYLQNLLWLINQQFRDLAREAYGGNAAVYACLRLLSSSVPEPPLIPHIRNPDGAPGDMLPWGHPLRMLIRTPNPLMTEYEFWELTTIYMGIIGRAHWWKERDNAGRIIALWPLRPDRVGPIYGTPDTATNDGGDGVLLGWSYQIPGTGNYLPLPRRDVLMFNFPDPAGESGGIVEGLGPLQVLAAEVGADNEATKFVGAMVSNYAMPGVILQTPDGIQDADEARMIKAAFVRDFGGAKRGEPAVVDAGTTVTSVSFTMQQMEFPNLRRVAESRIAAAFGTPAILVGLLVGLEAGIRATISEQRELFAETTLANYWRRYSDQYTNDVAVEFEPNVTCRFDLNQVRALVSENVKKMAQEHDAFVAGATYINEYRAAMGREPIPEGNVLAAKAAPPPMAPPSAAEPPSPKDDAPPASGTAARFNAHHDGHTGEFSSGGGGGGGGHVAPVHEIPASLDHFESSALGKAVAHEVSSGGVPGGGLPALHAVLGHYGYNGKPKVVSEAEMDTLLKDGKHLELFRGFGSDGKQAQYAEEYRTGEHFAGRGYFGNGTFAGRTLETAKVYNGRETKDSRHEGITRMAIPRDVKAVNYETLLKKHMEPRNSEAAATEAQLMVERGQVKRRGTDAEKARVATRETLAKTLFSDESAVAAMKGYDVVIVPASLVGGTEPHYIILNRSKVTVQREGAASGKGR